MGPTAASREADTASDGNGAWPSGADATQQVAAADGVTVPLELSTGVSDWCIGHALASGRASRIAIQLAHTTA